MAPKKGKKKDKKTERSTRSRSRSVTPRRHGDANRGNRDAEQESMETEEVCEVKNTTKRKSGEGKIKRGKKSRFEDVDLQDESRDTENENEGNDVAVNFLEDDQVVQISATGQDSEYQSDEDEASLTDAVSITENQSMISSNNNASVSREESCNRSVLNTEEKNEIIGQAIGQAVAQVKDLIASSGILETANLLQEQLKRQEQLQRNESERNKKQNSGDNIERNSIVDKDAERRGFKKTGTESEYNKINLAASSEATIYKNAIQDATKRLSSSSEDLIDTSDENLIEMENVDEQSEDGEVFINHLIAEQRKKAAEESKRGNGRYVNDGQQPSTSRQQDVRPKVTPEQRAQLLIQQAEQSKARVYETPGEIFENNNQGKDDHNPLIRDYSVDITKNFVHSAMVDEHYVMVGAHVDESTKQKIMKGEYIDFSKLIGKDRIADEEGAKYQMLFQGGRQFWAPVNEGTYINSFNRWEQAFRVFSNIYLKANPQRATELVQYNHLIHTASQEFVWSNVYKYDKDFRLHMGIFPSRNWGIILQQAWILRLREKLRNENSHSYNSHYGGGDQNNYGRDRTCRRFNKGRCTFGAGCKWEHKCKHCKMWGHGLVNCRKLKAEKAAGGQSQNHSAQQERVPGDGIERKPNNAETTHNK